MAGDAPTTVGAVAARYGIPEGALAKAFQQLVRAGLATGTRGIGGGYRLARPASKITVLDVMQVFEPRAPAERLSAPRSPRGQVPEDVRACGLQWLFTEVDEIVRSTYESVTLQTLVRRARRRTHS